MRRLLLLAASALLLLALVPAHAAAATTRVGPRLSLSFNDGDSLTLTVSGRSCVPIADAPTSVLVTADWMTDQVFTATPDATGHWSVDLPLPDDLEGSYLVNAECDDYYGTMTYPESGFGVLGASATGTPGAVDDPPPLANTGSHGGTAAVVGALLLGFGAGLVWLGRRRGARGA